MIRSQALPAILSLLLVTGILCGCADNRHINEKELMYKSHYWQRIESSSAIYTRGPKAQQMLHRDISRCVTEIRELERLGSLRNAMPAEDHLRGNPDTAPGALAHWETPERDGVLRAEHFDYHDFETCMATKGWERVQHVPYDVAEESRDVYIETIIGEQSRSKVSKQPAPKMQTDPDWQNLNE